MANTRQCGVQADTDSLKEVTFLASALLGCYVAKTPESGVPQIIGFIGVAAVICSRSSSVLHNITRAIGIVSIC